MAELLWTYSNQQEIKPISGNFPEAKFNQLAEEVQVEDLQKILGFDFYQDIIQNPDGEWNKKLLDGGEYTYNEKTYFYEGLKHVLAYFLYARYIRTSGNADTYGGFVKKQFEDSRALNAGEEGNYYKDFRKIAFKYWDECQAFIKANSEHFPYYYTDPQNSCWRSDSYRQGFCF